MMMESLHIKYRPKKFDDVVGQDSTIKALKSVLKRDGSRAFLFSGPSGCGKTTLARIVAKELKCSPKNIVEVDAATHTGVDAMRNVQQMLLYRPLGKDAARAIIVDEAHMLSKSAWNSLLKGIEEPPPNVSWFFCTTEPGKVPQTIKTRCTTSNLSLVKDEALTDLVKAVVRKEKGKLPSDVTRILVKEAKGSPRQALVNLSLCWDAQSAKEASKILESALESDSILELCRFLRKGGSWARAMKILDGLENENPESVRIVVMNYMAAVARKAPSDKQAMSILAVMEAFSQPYNASEKVAPLILSIGNVLLAE